MRQASVIVNRTWRNRKGGILLLHFRNNIAITMTVLAIPNSQRLFNTKAP